MINPATDLGAQSYCFRGWKTNEQVIASLRECGLSTVELCGIHADFTQESKCDEVIDLYRKSGIRIASIGVQGFACDESKERKYFEFVKRAGAKTMAVDFAVDRVPDCFRIAEKLADQYDVYLAIHNHGGRHWLGSAAMLKQVFNQTSPRIGLCLDTAWALHSHEDPIAMVEQFADRLYGLHVKDFIFDRSGKHTDVVVGTGNLDLVKLNQTLRKIGFKGYTVLEYEGDVENPNPAVKRCADAVRQAFGRGT